MLPLISTVVQLFSPSFTETINLAAHFFCFVRQISIRKQCVRTSQFDLRTYGHPGSVRIIEQVSLCTQPRSDKPHANTQMSKWLTIELP